MTLNQVLSLATTIKTETVEDANSAARVGGALENIINFFSTYDRTITVASFADLDRVDLAGGMYNVSGGADGRLIVTPTYNGEVLESVLQLYYSSSGVRIRRIEIANPQTYPAWTWDNDYQRNVVGKILSDTTYANEWLTGAEVTEQGDSIIQLENHGLAVGDVVEFDHGTGQLPDGIEAYNLSVIGNYYNVCDVFDSNLFRITAVTGGSGFIINDYGTPGWRLRKGLSSFRIDINHTGTDFNALKMKIFINYGFVNNTPNRMFMSANSGNASFFGGENPLYAYFGDAAFFNKLSASLIKLDIKFVEENMYDVSFEHTLTKTTNKQSYTPVTSSRQMFLYTDNGLQYLNVRAGNNEWLHIRSARVIIYQQ